MGVQLSIPLVDLTFGIPDSSKMWKIWGAQEGYSVRKPLMSKWLPIKTCKHVSTIPVGSSTQLWAAPRLAPWQHLACPLQNWQRYHFLPTLSAAQQCFLFLGRMSQRAAETVQLQRWDISTRLFNSGVEQMGAPKPDLQGSRKGRQDQNLKVKVLTDMDSTCTEH